MVLTECQKPSLFGGGFLFSWSVGLVFLPLAAKVMLAFQGSAEAAVLSCRADPGYSLRGVR